MADATLMTGLLLIVTSAVLDEDSRACAPLAITGAFALATGLVLA